MQLRNEKRQFVQNYGRAGPETQNPTKRGVAKLQTPIDADALRSSDRAAMDDYFINR
ncbi:MAG: hypothetical protein GX948_06030 [Clostridiaceae bacterium]|nr:hypothetical protein [Clostridia bacterium]MBP6950241.1 hypothetical protein [Clostridia bacterium]NMA36392.1 hypothetical protein [Clostridiaceae bacterium]